jgi:transposase
MALKQAMVARLTGVNAPSAAQLARETGITQQNLSRWLSEALGSPTGATDAITSSWTVEEKARVIAQAAGLAGDQLTVYLQREGVKLGYFRRWRRALEEAGEESVGMTKRIRKLERALARKESALAEAAALLLLRETIESQDQKEDDGFDELVDEEPASNCSMAAGGARNNDPPPSSSVADPMRRNNAFSRVHESESAALG